MPYELFNKVKTVVFDYDGTIHDSGEPYIKGFQKAYAYLVEKGFAEERVFKKEEMTCWLGYSSTEMWKAFMPELPETEKEKASDIIRSETMLQVKGHNSRLYDGAEETLLYLKERGYHVLYLSNCRPYYRQMHTETFHLERFFEEMYCAGDYQFAPKYEIFKEIMKKYPSEYIMIGDRFHDMEAAKYCRAYAVGCAYGFGSEEELAEADVQIADIRELKNFL